MLNGKAFLFGLNYANDSSVALNGCINDVQNMASYLQTEVGIPCEVFTDDVNQQYTSAMGMLNKLYEIAMLSYRENLDLVWIHYSGHGSYIVDTSHDERDGMDEALVPCDFKTAGLIPDDYISSLFSYFNPNTRVIFVFDCCHAATMGDVRYSWEDIHNVVVENAECKAPARIITLSGCLDDQTSADAYNVLRDNKYVGALSACLLMALNEDKEGTWSNVFKLVNTVRDKLKQHGFSQVAKLCSTHDLAEDAVFIPHMYTVPVVRKN